MKHSMKWRMIFVSLTIYLAGISLVNAENQVIPRVTNFIILADESG